MPDRTDRNFLRIALFVFIGVLVIAAILFGTQIVTTNEQGATVQAPQAPAKREPGVNPSAQ
jgi:hypothetical protein